MKQKYYIMAIIIVILSICLFQSCDKDCPVCPKDDTGEAGNYRLYVINGWSNTLISIDTPADTVIDSVSLGYNSYGLYVTPDGNGLLVGNGDTRQMEVYNTTDLSHIESIDQYGDYYFDKTDNIGIYYSIMTEKLFFIDIATLVPYDSIPCNIYNGFFDTVTNIFISPKVESTNIVYLIDCNSRTLTDSIDLGYYCWDLAYNCKTDEIYFHGSPGLGSAFFAYDLVSKSATFAINTISPLGSVSISLDGSKVYMSDGGDGLHSEYPRGDIWVINSETHEIIDLIPPYIFPPGDKIDIPLFGDIRITPDGKRAYIGTSGNNNGYVPVAVVDLKKNRIINGIFQDEKFWAKDIILGPVPE